jgi:hypothetical protein
MAAHYTRMRVEFLHDPTLRLGVAHTVHISIYTPFGEAVASFCRHFGVREHDWRFIAGKREDGSYVDLDNEDTGHRRGKSDTDDFIVYCIPRDTTN